MLREKKPGIPTNKSKSCPLKSKAYATFHNISNQNQVLPRGRVKKPVKEPYWFHRTSLKCGRWGQHELTWTQIHSLLLFRNSHSLPPSMSTAARHCQLWPWACICWFNSESLWTGNFSKLSSLQLITVQKMARLKGSTTHKGWAEGDHWGAQAFLISHPSAPLLG